MKDGSVNCYLMDNMCYSCHFSTSLLDLQITTPMNHKTCLIVQPFVAHKYCNFFNFSCSVYPVCMCIIAKENVNTVKLIEYICSV
jgi:hypothetical protein